MRRSSADQSGFPRNVSGLRSEHGANVVLRPGRAGSTRLVLPGIMALMLPHGYPPPLAVGRPDPAGRGPVVGVLLLGTGFVSALPSLIGGGAVTAQSGCSQPEVDL